MSKVLISPLGVGPLEKEIEKRKYSKATYKFSNLKKEYRTPFIAAALAEHLQVDKIIFLGTGRSMWEEVYRYFTIQAGHNLDEDYWLNLDEKIQGSNYSNSLVTEKYLTKTNYAIDTYLKHINEKAEGGSYCKLIHYGINSEQLWENFDIFMSIIDLIDDGDEIYLDITHSFRSIPLFMYLMMDFIQTLNRTNIHLAGIYYGMIDVRKEMGYAPVVDLKPLFIISNWIRGTYDFINYGNGYIISDLINEEDMSKKISNISELTNINYLVDLKKQIISLRKILTKKEGNNLKVLKHLGSLTNVVKSK